MGRAEGSLSGLIQNDLDEAMYVLSYADAGGPLRLNIRCYLPAPQMLNFDSIVKHIRPIQLVNE